MLHGVLYFSRYTTFTILLRTILIGKLVRALNLSFFPH